MISKQLALVLLLSTACGKGGDSGGSKTTGGGGKGGCEVHPAKTAELVTTKSVSLPAPLDKLALGMSRDDVAKACPNFFTGDDAKKTGTFSVGEIVGQVGEIYLQPRLELVDNKLDAVAYTMPADVADVLTTAWGAPKQSSGPSPALAWFDDAKHVRAILEPTEDGKRELVISSYMPLAAFVEGDPARIAWKPAAVLGKSPAELAKTFPQYQTAHPTSAATKAKTDEMMKGLNEDLKKQGIDVSRNDNMPELELPAAPFNDDRTKIMLYADDDGTLRSYGLWFHTHNLMPEYGFPQQSAELVKLLDESWGAHKVVKETLGERSQWYDAKNGIRAGTHIDKPEDMDLTFVRYLPLAKLFGEPGPTWGFEVAERPLIGATPDEIVATYGKVGIVKRDDANNTITLYLPTTDYDGDTARTSILMFVEKGKVREWRFHLPYEDYEPARAEYEAALAAKYKLAKLPAPDKYGSVKLAKGVVAEFSDITHALDLQIGAK